MLSLLLATLVSSQNTTTETRISSTANRFDHLSYKHYELEFDCKEKAAVRWSYTLTPQEDGQAKRPRGFYYDPNYPQSCQQLSTKSYGDGYDRGHLVTSSHMDMTTVDRRESHYMNNVLPQAKKFNQGIWQDTELITSCIRLLRPITVYGGVIFNDPQNDFFLKSHGVKTPDFWWKVLVTRNDRDEEEVISWFFPNIANVGSLDQYLLSVKEIESRLIDGLGDIPISNELKTVKPGSKWTQSCSSTFRNRAL
jgi:endonuclease G, mitochondrial